MFTLCVWSDHVFYDFDSSNCRVLNLGRLCTPMPAQLRLHSSSGAGSHLRDSLRRDSLHIYICVCVYVCRGDLARIKSGRRANPNRMHSGQGQGWGTHSRPNSPRLHVGGLPLDPSSCTAADPQNPHLTLGGLRPQTLGRS